MGCKRRKGHKWREEEYFKEKDCIEEYFEQRDQEWKQKMEEQKLMKISM